MPQFQEFAEFDRWRSSVVAIGNFDGVHHGHQAMIAALRRAADALGAPAVAMTFDPAPIEILQPAAAPPRLMRLEQKAHYLKQAGADAILALPTDRRLLELEPEAFFQEVLVGALAVSGLVEGPNFRFGRDRRGDVTLLRELCERSGRTLTVVEPVYSGTELVSSSRIRRCVAEGDLPAAARMLTRPHEVIGTVVRGSDRGRGLGFPTANLAGISTLLPPDGVYAARAEIDGQAFSVAVHMGANSTFAESDRRFEAHLLDFDGDLYGRSLRLEMIERLRGSVRFDSPQALVEQLRIDCDRVRRLLATPPTVR